MIQTAVRGSQKGIRDGVTPLSSNKDLESRLDDNPRL